ncbi:MAG: hypothetical protein J6F33_07760 [Acidaminococcaceae bacterium]|nr:hypothetical protein [Acidaminococcaceae bacterium]
MRNHLIKKILEFAKCDNRIMMMTGDLGFGVLDEFQSKFPNRFINVGIAEQNMAAVASGLALEGNMVFMYSIGNFSTLRCVEQIRNDICYHNANVKILSVGCGFSYGKLGMTHHATENIAMMRSLPNMQIYAPCDYISAEKIAEVICKNDNPCYIHLEKGGEDNLFQENSFIDVGKLQCLQKGRKVAVLCLGTIASEALNANKKLTSIMSVYAVLSIKPINKKEILLLAKENEYIITLEEQNIYGGLGSAVAEILAEAGVSCKLIRMGLNDEYTSIVGDQMYLRKVYGLNSESIVRRVCKIMKEN